MRTTNNNEIELKIKVPEKLLRDMDAEDINASETISDFVGNLRVENLHGTAWLSAGRLYEAAFLRPIDGDTIVVQMNQGLGVYTDRRLRLY